MKYSHTKRFHQIYVTLNSNNEHLCKQASAICVPLKMPPNWLASSRCGMRLGLYFIHCFPHAPLSFFFFIPRRYPLRSHFQPAAHSVRPSVRSSNPSIHPSLWRANEIERVYLFIRHLSANLAYGQSDPDMMNDSEGFARQDLITNFKNGLMISLSLKDWRC